MAGGKTYQEIYEKFKAVNDSYASDGITLTFQGQRGAKKISIPLESSGLTADAVVEYFLPNDWEKTIKAAYDLGRSGSVFQKAAEQISLLGRKTFVFSYALREEAVSSLLARELRSFLIKPEPAQFVMEEGKIIIKPEKIGEEPDHQQILRAVREALAIMATTTLEFNAKPAIPKIKKEDLEPYLKFAQELGKSVTGVFSYNSRRWYVSGNTLASWLTLKGDGALGVSPDKLRAFLIKNITPIVDDPPRNSRFEIRNGKLVETVPGKSGNVVDIKGTEGEIDEILGRVKQSLGLASLLAVATFDPKTGIIQIPLEIVKEEPRVTQATIDQYDIRELAGTARTGFAGSSADRRHNIKTGVSKLNGVLLAPGEEFSAVEAIGYTTEEEGFVKEYVIKENRSVKELGGGLCQIATTLFRLALDAGLPITERQNHRYVVSYYGPGLDATIYGPKPDLRFVNDTENYLLLQGRIDGNDLVFEFYGQKDGRVASVSDIILTDPIPAPDTKYITGPDLPLGEVQCSETPRGGITAEATYKIEYPNGEIKEQVFQSVYQPWQKICLIGLKAR